LTVGCDKVKRENIALRELIEEHNTAMKQLSRKIDNNQITLDRNGVKLDKINGTVKRHKNKYFPDVFGRLRKLEDIDKVEEGIEIGKTKMSTSTKNTITIIGCIATCFFLGSAIFLLAQKNLNKSVVKEMSTGMGDRYRESDALRDMKVLITRIENIENREGE
jgi:hypothetical protein